MKTVKEQVRKMLDELPDDVSIEEIERQVREASEYLKLGQAGRRLAGSVWPKEDFSDWENPREST